MGKALLKNIFKLIHEFIQRNKMTRGIKVRRYTPRVRSVHIYVIFLIILISFTVYTLLPYYGVQDYKGDEVWYVDAARNYLVHVGVSPTYIYHYGNGTYPPGIYYGVNVLINIPFWNGTSFNQQDALSRVSYGDSSDALGLLNEIYNWNDTMYIEILQKALNSTNPGHVVYFPGLYRSLTNNAYFLVGGSSDGRTSRLYERNFIKAVQNIRAPKDVYITVYYKKPVYTDGRVVYVNKTLRFLAFRKGERMFYVVPGFRYADVWGIQYYYNFEHPFLGKAFIIASMYLFGDNPEAWRLPSMIAYVIILLSVAFTVLNLTKSYFWSSVGALLVAIDPGLRMLGTTAMLDIFVAMFSALTMVALSRRKLKWASLFVGLGGAVKLNGWFLGLAIAIILILEIRELKSFREQIKAFFKNGVKYGLISICAFVGGMLPIELFFRFNQWWPSFAKGTLWLMHRSIPHPFQSPIWDWFFNRNPFTIYYYPRIMIQTNWFLWLLALVFSVVGIFVVYDIKTKTEFDWVNTGLWSLWIMWLVVYLIGSRAQYSYYDVQITPFVIAVFVVSFARLLCWRDVKDSVLYSLMGLPRIPRKVMGNSGRARTFNTLRKTRISGYKRSRLPGRRHSRRRARPSQKRPKVGRQKNIKP